MASKLTPKQERFCLAYVESGNASQAYRAAYETGKMKRTTINREAKNLLDNPKVATRIDSLYRSMAKRHAVTVDSLTEELEAARLSAIVFGNTSAAVSATMGKAKLHGLIIDKQDVTKRVSLDDLSDDELDDYIERLEQEVAGRETGASTTH
jgi:phage terminase small subunit